MGDKKRWSERARAVRALGSKVRDPRFAAMFEDLVKNLEDLGRGEAESTKELSSKQRDREIPARSKKND
jgi:hypothetical protein